MTIALFALVAMVSLPVLASADTQLDAARSLYLAAAYEDALDALAKVPAGVDVDEADKVRALCLLALNRTKDAEAALEPLALRHPSLTLGETESPKLVALFNDVRAHALPAAARAQYAAAKDTFEKGDLPSATAQFDGLLTLLSEPLLANQPSFSDMKVLAEGFLKLARQQLDAAARQAGAQQAAARQASELAPQNGSAEAANDASKTAPVSAMPAPATQSPPQTTRLSAPPVAPAIPPAASQLTAPRIYTADDADVVPPVSIEQALPRWTPPPGEGRVPALSGVLEIVIDESGAVSSVSMVSHLNVHYDQLLMATARHWRYRPARRNGKPVKFRKQLNIVLRPE